MQNVIQNITEDLQQAKIALKQIYTVLNSTKYDDPQKQKQEIGKIAEKNMDIPIEKSSFNIEKTISSEKEFDYKMAAHDLISPLATQFTLLDVLKEECLEVKEKLNKALQNIDFLTLSNSESLKRSKAALSNVQQTDQPIPFKQLIDGIIQLLGISELHKDVHIIMHINTKKDFYNNIAIVQSIIQNLIQNAVKYKKINQQNTITIKINDTNKGIEIIIEDTGIGIATERLQQLFSTVIEKDDTVKHSHGFGLYGVAQYVEKLNGTITAQSVVNVGSSFIVNLPTLSL